MITSRRITAALGYAGLLPFVVPALLVVSASGHEALSASIAQIYAFGIICFLTGSWWGLALTPGNPVVLLLSNIFFLVAFFTFFFAPAWWPLAAALLLIGIFVAELNPFMFPAFPAHYRNMRKVLTLVASASLLAIHVAR